MKSCNPREFRRFFAFWALFVFEIFLLSSCTAPQAGLSPNVSPSEEKYVYHRIKYSGETVAVISAWYTKSAKNWPEIVDANPKMVPSKLRLGDIVRIPKNIVKRSGPLPSEFVTSFKNGVNKDTSKSGLAASPEISATPISKEALGSDSGLKIREMESVAKEEKGRVPALEVEKKEQIMRDASSVVESKLPKEKELLPAVNFDAGTASGGMAEENQKIRDQLMQELLQ